VGLDLDEKRGSSLDGNQQLLNATFLRHLPRYRNWPSAMAERMSRDLVFDHFEATRDFGFEPRPFVLSAEDVPK
jgi:hypothetical protein